MKTPVLNNKKIKKGYDEWRYRRMADGGKIGHLV